MNVPKLCRSSDGLVTPSEVVRVYKEWDSMQGFEMKPQILVGLGGSIAHVMIPKNAHHSANWFMRPYEEVEKPVDDCTAFAIIRNPIKRFISGYLLVNDALGYPAPGIGRLVQGFPYWKINDPIERFAQYVRDVSFYGLYEEHIMTQSYYLDIDVEVDEYIVFENLKEQMKDFISKHSLDTEFPVITFRKFPELSVVLWEFLLDNRKYWDILADLYSDDFELYINKAGRHPG